MKEGNCGPSYESPFIYSHSSFPVIHKDGKIGIFVYFLAMYHVTTQYMKQYADASTE